MSEDKILKDNLEDGGESFDKLIERPMDELAAFIGGDRDVFNTLVEEVDRLEISESEKAEKITKLHDAAVASGIKFETVDQL